MGVPSFFFSSLFGRWLETPVFNKSVNTAKRPKNGNFEWNFSFQKERTKRATMPKMQPEQLKQAGNKAFAAGNIQAALGAYSFALERLEQGEKARADGEGKRERGDGGNKAGEAGDALRASAARRLRATLLSNRALCLGKVGEHAEALRDAEGAIAADPTFAGVGAQGQRAAGVGPLR